MRTLTHEPLAFAFAALLLVAIVAGLTVPITLAIQTRSGRKARPTGAGTEQASSPLGASGPGVVSMRLATPGPDTCDCSAYPWLDGKHDVWCKADPIAKHIDTAAALLIADDWKPTDRLDLGTEAEWWLAIGAPEGWAPPPVVPGRSES